jgi:uncharacterized repeat protein (TIGR03803 family)
VQDTDGNLYGTTLIFGANGSGTVFKISPRGTLTTLYSFCSKSACGDGSNPAAPLGTDLTGATGVAFNGTAAFFKVMSASLITTNVPMGATTGTGEVTTPKVTLKSNVAFRVTK